jgi:hypothetical protein
MSKKPKKKNTGTPPSEPRKDLLRQNIQKSEFSAKALRRLIDVLQQEFEQGEEPYWLEGATEAIAEYLSKLVCPDDTPDRSNLKLAEVLSRLSDQLGVGSEAAAAATELASAQSTLWYDDGDTEDLENARDALEDALSELADLLERYED